MQVRFYIITCLLDLDLQARHALPLLCACCGRAHGEAGAHKASETQMLPPPPIAEKTRKKDQTCAPPLRISNTVWASRLLS